MLTKKDWTLLVIAAAERPVSPVQLQKSLFLLERRLSKREKKVREFYDFEAYDYGPFCREIYDDARDLSEQGLVSVGVGGRYRVYSATDRGGERAAELGRELPPKASAYLAKVVTWVMGLSFNQLISAIYRDFPEMKENSVFQG